MMMINNFAQLLLSRMPLFVFVFFFLHIILKCSSMSEERRKKKNQFSLSLVEETMESDLLRMILSLCYRLNLHSSTYHIKKKGMERERKQM